MSIGVEFTYHSGEKDWFDPVNADEFVEREQESHYLFSVLGYEHIVYKRDVKSVRKYDLCQECGYEVGRCEHTALSLASGAGSEGV